MVHAQENNTEGSTSFSSPNEQGQHKPYNKTSNDLLENVRSHTSSFPTIDPHCVRVNTSRKFLGSDLNILKTYNLYVEA